MSSKDCVPPSPPPPALVRRGPQQPRPTPPRPVPVPQIGSYYGSEITAVDIDGDGVTDILLVGAPMYFSEGRERGRVYVYNLKQVLLWGAWQPPRGTGSLPSPWCPRGKLGRGRGPHLLLSQAREARKLLCRWAPAARGGMLGRQGRGGREAAGQRGSWPLGPCQVPLSLFLPLLFQNRFVYNGTLKDSHSYQNARFGASIAWVRDLNQDSYNDVVVGAPLEDSHGGAIYIFHGCRGSLLKTPKQVAPLRELGPRVLAAPAQPLARGRLLCPHPGKDPISYLCLPCVPVVKWVHFSSGTSTSPPGAPLPA